MPAHVKAALLGSSITIPITDGRFNLGAVRCEFALIADIQFLGAVGTWQGIWLCEHRNHAKNRKIVVTLNGAAA